MWQYLRRLHDQGMTVFLTTQYMEEADQLCQRLAIIDQGKIVAEGTPTALKAPIGADSRDTRTRHAHKRACSDLVIASPLSV